MMIDRQWLLVGILALSFLSRMCLYCRYMCLCNVKMTQQVMGHMSFSGNSLLEVQLSESIQHWMFNWVVLYFCCKCVWHSLALGSWNFGIAAAQPGRPWVSRGRLKDGHLIKQDMFHSLTYQEALNFWRIFLSVSDSFLGLSASARVHLASRSSLLNLCPVGRAAVVHYSLPSLGFGVKTFYWTLTNYK